MLCRDAFRRLMFISKKNFLLLYLLSCFKSQHLFNKNHIFFVTNQLKIITWLNRFKTHRTLWSYAYYQSPYLLYSLTVILYRICAGIWHYCQQMDKQGFTLTKLLCYNFMEIITCRKMFSCQPVLVAQEVKERETSEGDGKIRKFWKYLIKCMKPLNNCQIAHIKIKWKLKYVLKNPTKTCAMFDLGISSYVTTSQIFMRTSYYFTQNNSIAYVGHCTLVCYSVPLNHLSWQYSCLYRLVHMFV